MSKYIIEVEDNAVNGLFKAKGFNALVFDQNGLDKLQKYEEELVKEEQPWPQYGDEYYVISGDAVIRDCSYDDDNVDHMRMDIGNCFRTREEAEFALERLKVLAEMSKFAEPFDTTWEGRAIHYYFYCDFTGELAISYHSAMRTGQLYFTSEKRARECIKSVGEDRIKKFYIGVE